ncbi:hypothetical protein EJ05DRAFT_478650 [Pseudovirgaria hyperparasitica]|uniref:Uncharacterized protein n=1 Tax=Pseudovirgaria hyperparasitica TaxID=470096 RepID=A0A6A6VZF8_9PEZI|nr:uncharacterized protein EJ05DRAFT_478650 [Pseudovirgaria hyperparasitica]KAF2755693.1 hypothetical protein EJ05DRAFT_478650 [Pseudovirgaria hyperparasitica]
MVPTLKRKRPQVSYRESSPEDEHSFGSNRTSERSDSSDIDPSPRRSSRKGSKPSSQVSSTRTRRTHALRRPGSSRPSYREPSSDLDDDLDFAPVHVSPIDQPRAKGSRVHNKPRLRTSPQKSSSQNTASRSKRASRNTNNIRGSAKSSAKDLQKEYPSSKIISDGIIPAWTELPYHILLQVFVYASYPISENTTWLLNVARLHQNFLEPALTALYRCPPVTTLTKSQHMKLLSTLLEPTEGRLYNYNVKVQRLELDSTNMMNYNSPQGGIFDLSGLVSSLPQLNALDIFDPGDKPPYRRRKSVRWHYPDAMFSAMQRNEVHLKSWRWNALLLWTDQTPAWMADLHQTTPFQSVCHVTFSNFTIEERGGSMEEGEQAPTRSEAMASALSVLPKLRGLAFESCTLIDGPFLAVLPKVLSSLNLTNCLELTAETLQIFLDTHGGNLKELTLNHNQALNLSFLSNLKTSCPVLESLTMDLNYYSTFTTSNDADPKYDELLSPKNRPTWPSTLQYLDMIYLRKWTTEAAETFFESLVDSAAQLPNLRTLILKATGILDISWRDRARLRDEWVARMQRVFLARPDPPSAHLISLRAFREWKQVHIGTKASVARDGPNTPRQSSNTKRISHVQVTPGGQNHSSVVDSDSDVPILRRVREQYSTKRRLRPRTAAAEPLVQSNDSEDEKESAPREEDFIQGLCTVVDVVIDNIRPREEIFHEEDFLDAEISGDEDWDENSPNEFNDAGYAW